MVVVMTAGFLLIAILGIFRSGSERISRFDFSLPTINVVWAFASVQYVLTAMGGNKMLLGLFGLTVAAGHLAAAFWLAGRQVERAPGTNSFTFAGAVLLALSLPVAAGSMLTTSQSTQTEFWERGACPPLVSPESGRSPRITHGSRSHFSFGK